MKSFRLAVVIFSMLFGASIVDPAYSANSTLEPIETPEFDQLLVASEITLSSSRKIHIKTPTVSFAKRWFREHGQETSNHYRESIVKQYAKSLKNELAEKLNEAGWEVVKSSNAVIKLTPQIYDLYILAPDTPGIKQTIVSYVGAAGIELEFLSANNQTFMKITDYAKTQDSGAVPSNRVNNFHHFKRLMSKWSTNAVVYLEEIMKIADAQAH